MNTNLSFRGAAILTSLLLTLSLSPLSKAIDGGLGRSISGAQIEPYQALVPPDPGGIYVSLAEDYYTASIGGGRTLLLGGKLLANIDADISFTPLTVAYVWPTASKQWNFLSAVVVPFAYEKLTANVTFPNGVSLQKSDTATGLFDLMFRVIQAGYHFSQTAHFSMSLDVWAPTGNYDVNDLANLSLDNWTIIPTISYTQIMPEENIELSALWALEYYTENRHTDYKSGVLSRMEVMVLKRFNAELGAGIVGSWMTQLNADEGPLADRFDGFEGRAYGVGPIVTYSVKAGAHEVSLSARWIHEFQNKNMLQGDVFTLSAGTRF